MNNSQNKNEISTIKYAVYQRCVILKDILGQPGQSINFKDIPEENKLIYEKMQEEGLLRYAHEQIGGMVNITGYCVSLDGKDILKQHGHIINDQAFKDDNN